MKSPFFASFTDSSKSVDKILISLRFRNEYIMPKFIPS